MEVVVTGHNFESILPKDQPCHVCFKLADWFQRRLLNNFPIGPMLKLCPLTVAILDRDRVTEHNFGSWPPKDHRWHVCYISWLVSEEKILKHFFPIGFYVKTMSAEGGHLGWRSVSLDTILKIDHLRTIHAMFALIWLTGFRRRFLNIFPIGSYVKTMSAAGGHLGWRSGWLDIILKVDNLRTIHAMFALNWLTGFRGKKI